MRLAAVLPVVLLAASAHAADFSGSATTIFRTFDVVHVELRENDQPIQKIRTYRPLDQHLRLTWDDFGRRGAWAADVALRYRVDLGTGKGRWQEDDLDVLLASVRWKSPKDLLGLTLGRQQAITGLGWHAFDGVRLDFDRAPRIKAFVQAGLPVDLWDGGGSDLHGFTWAAGVTGVVPKHGSISVDYELRRGESRLIDPLTGGLRVDEGVVLEETAGLDARFTAGKWTLQANADYSLLLDEAEETTLVVGRSVKRRHHVEARWQRVRPVFPSDSIFAAFDLNPYDETRLQYEFRGDGPVDVGGYFSVEDYVSARPDADPPDPGDLPDDLPEDIRRLAVFARWEGRRETVHRSELGWQRGWTGNRLAVKHDSDFGLNPRWRAGGGLSVHRYENRYRLDEEDEVVAARGRIRHDHDGKWDLALEVEQFFGRDRDTTRGTLVFTTHFGGERGHLPWWGGRWNWSKPTHSRTRPVAVPRGAQAPAADAPAPAADAPASGEADR